MLSIRTNTLRRLVKKPKRSLLSTAYTKTEFNNYIQISSRACSTLMLRPNSEAFRFNSKSGTRKQLVSNSFYSIDNRNIVSLGLFGLWGKQVNKEDLANASKLDVTMEKTAASASGTSTTSESVQEAAKENIYESTGYIPEPPPIMDENLVFNTLGEPTLQSLGLASNFTPVGWVQSLLEYLHVYFDLPWFQAIICFSIGLKILLLPITVLSQRNAVKMRKLGPAMTAMNERVNEARLSGNAIELARRTHEYTQFMTNNDIGLKSFGVTALQFPFVVSAFIGIRKMCKLPVESMFTGGYSWFTDLTIADPYYLLPLFASLSILAVVHRGVDTGMSAQNMTYGTKALVYGLSFISFPFFLFMPSGVMVYVCSQNVVSLLFSLIFNNNAVKRKLKIPILSESDLLAIKESSKNKKSFIDGFKDSIKSKRLVAEISERESLREKQFQQAGNKMPVKTFKTKPPRKP